MNIIGIEAGNTRTKLGFFADGRLIHSASMPTDGISNAIIPVKMDFKPSYIGLASVVPSVNAAIIKKFGDIYKKKISVLKAGECGIPLNIKKPAKVGIDRVMNCKAALKLFGSAVIVVDIGTAITVDAATKTQGFAGGTIIPGPELWIGGLSAAAQLKNIKASMSGFPGKTTDEAITAGIKYGLPGAINAILEKALKRYPSAAIVLTGGNSGQFSRSIKFKFTKRENLALEGIAIVFAEKAEKHAI